jgi:hypothetical protein
MRESVYREWVGDTEYRIYASPPAHLDKNNWRVGVRCVWHDPDSGEEQRRLIVEATSAEEAQRQAVKQVVEDLRERYEPGRR